MNIALFFSQMALVTFGGAYAVLTYVAQQAVEQYQWLTPDQMVDGLALAETTPGPLVLVLTYVGFLAGTQTPLWGQPVLGGLLGAVIATWVTFAPCFLWVFAGAPHIERMRHNRKLSSALATITAAVVGVILNLALWFALHVMFAEVNTFGFGPVDLLVPDLASFNTGAFLIAVATGVVLLRLRWNLILVLLLAAAAGIVVSTIAPGLVALSQ
jgi:chromate transporter